MRKELEKTYNPKDIEDRLYTKWLDKKYFHAVVDKDLTSRLLAESLGADLLVISTGVANVAVNFGKPEQENLARIDVDTLQKHMDEGQFPKGSMGPKIQAAIDFIRRGGAEVIITNPQNLGKAIREGAGTHVVAG